MKIAYTMSGMPRFVENCASSQLLLINKLREKHIVDIYCQFNAFLFHQPEDNDLSASKALSNSTIDDVTKTIKDLYNPTDIIVATLSKYQEYMNVLHGTPHYITGQHTGFIDVVSFISKDYDIVIKSRYDNFINPEKINLFSDDISNTNEELVYGNLHIESRRSDQKASNRYVLYSWDDKFFWGELNYFKQVYNKENLNRLAEFVKKTGYNVLIISGPGCYSALHFVSGIGSTQRQVHNGIGIRKDVLLYRDYHENETNFYELTKLQENHNY